MKKFSLVIVNMQYDFYDPNGSMYVKSSKGLLEDMLSYIKNNHEHIHEVIFTLDWHSPDHCSFKENGGEWEPHCVAFTKGSSIPQELVKICNTYSLPIQIVTKGEYEEEYGAFRYMRLSYTYEKDHFIYLDTYNKTTNTQFAICGLCGDYCVLETIKNLRDFNNHLGGDLIKVVAIPHLIASMDGGKTFYDYADNTDLILINELI